MPAIRMSVAAKGSAMKIPLSATAFSMFVITASLAGGAPASAQSFWGSSWGANSVSDRQRVSFPRRHAPGQIILSFGDRRLYYILRRGRALSYPIAVPHARDRWQGVERVSMKRVNPPWTPTPRGRCPPRLLGGHCEHAPALLRSAPGADPRSRAPAFCMQ